MNMLKQIKEIIGRKRTWQMRGLLIIMTFGSFLEMLGISLVVSVCSLMVDEKRMAENWLVAKVCGILRLRPGRPFLAFLCVSLMGLYLFKALYLIMENYILLRFIRLCRHSVTMELFRGFLSAPYEFFIKMGASDVISALNHDVGQFSGCLSACLHVIMEGLVILCAGILLMAVNPVMMMFIGLGIVILILLVQLIISRHNFQSGILRRQMNRERLKWMNQAVHGIKDVKIGRTEDFFVESYRQADWKFIRADYINHMWTVVPRICVEAVMVICVLLYVLLLVITEQDLVLFIPSLSALALAVVRLLPACNKINSELSRMSYGRSSLTSVLEYTRQVRERKETLGAMPHQDVKLQESIVLEGVSFCYEGRSEPVLEDVDMVVPIGSSVGIIGVSGAGKTTLVDVLLGLLTPASGRVLADGVDIRDCRDSYLMKIAYIPQMTFLMDDSIRSNVAMGVPAEKIDDGQVWEALRNAALDDLVHRLPEGLDTQVGERGIRLSGGERQRLGFARALYRRCPVMVFDESTSALDEATEASILESIHNLKAGTTLIIISHRPSAIAGCDRIYRIEDAKAECIMGGETN